ncbi:MAG: hypothetical protein QME52_14310, partial [Bacteroidota bacterium]|nr:hypothetical protein [Bacteroidota bacterium]
MKEQNGITNSEHQRLREKSRRNEFVETLGYEFELSPRESYGIYDVVEDMFLKKETLREGQIRYVAVRREELSGP